MQTCYVIVEEMEFLTKKVFKDSIFKVLCVHKTYESASKHLHALQRERSDDVEWSDFGYWFSYIKPNAEIPLTSIREDVKITVGIKFIDYLDD